VQTNKILRLTVIFFLVVLVGIQFIPIQRNENKGAIESDFITTYSPPKAVKNILKVACYNCHSNNTEYPWYSYIQPIGWFLKSHIDEGKSELNFSEFNDYSSRMKQLKLKSISNQIEDGEMPLPSYLILHEEAELSKQDKEALISYIKTLMH
jgi:hypothetical protein